MDILQVCPFTLQEVGGVQEHVRRISEQLARRHNVTVYSTDSRSKFPRCEVINGVRIKRFRRYAPRDAFIFSLDMLLQLRKTHFDVVHGHSYHDFPMHFSAVAKCRKFVVTTHFHGVGHTPFTASLVRLLKPFGRATLEKADTIVAVSEYEKELLLRQFGFDPSKVHVIPNGIDFRELSGLTRRNHSFKSILCVGWLLPYKGMQHIVEVLPRLENDVVLEIVGRGPMRHYLEERAKALKVFDRVRFYDYLQRSELWQKYLDANVFVLTSYQEAYSLVVAESLAAGTPCVVADTSALSEWIDNESCFGVSVPIHLDELAKKINYILDNGIDKQSMKKWVGTKILDWSDVTDRLETVYESNLRN